MLPEYLSYMEKIKIKESLKLVMAISKLGNIFLQETQPWVLFKSDATKCQSVVATSCGLVLVLATLAEPFMPHFTDKVLQQMNYAREELVLDDNFVER